ncbi:MAG: hypothetical protein WCX65_03015 [bacterium]
MTRWSFLLFPIVSAAIFAAALIFAPRPPQAIMGVVDAADVFNRRPDVITLKKAEAAAKSAAPAEGSFGSLRADDFQRSILNSEWDAVRLGMEQKNDRLFTLWSNSLNVNLQQDYLLLFSDLSGVAANEFSETERKLRAAFFVAASAEFQKDDPLKAEKFKLLNLRLKLRVLTHDPFVLPDSLIKEIQDDIKSIETVISDAQISREERLRAAYASESEAIREKFRADAEKKEKELNAKARSMLADTESAMAELIQNQKKDMKQKLEESRLARNVVLKTTAEGAGIESMKSDSQIFDDMRKELRIESDRRLRKKAVAVAERNHLYLILNTPYQPVGKHVVNVTDEF